MRVLSAGGTFPPRVSAFPAVLGWAWEWAGAVVPRRGGRTWVTAWEEGPDPLPILLPSSVSEELTGEGTDRGGLPNNVFGVWGTGDPPLVGFDDGGHRGLLGGRTALDVLVILQDAAKMEQETEVWG